MREIAKALALCDECFNLPFDVYQLPLQLTMCSAIENHLKKTTPSTGRCYVLRSLSILLRQPQKLAFSMSQVQGGWNSMLASVLHNCNVYTVGVSVGFLAHYWDPVSGVDSVRWRDFCMPWPRQHEDPT